MYKHFRGTNLFRLLLIWTALVGLMAFLFALGLSEKSDLPTPWGLKQNNSWDIGHLLAFMALSCLLWFTIKATWKLRSLNSELMAYGIILFVCAMIGAGIERLQSLTLQDHKPSTMDLGIDMLGTLIGLISIAGLRALISKSKVDDLSSNDVDQRLKEGAVHFGISGMLFIGLYAASLVDNRFPERIELAFFGLFLVLLGMTAFMVKPLMALLTPDRKPSILIGEEKPSYFD